MSTLGTSNLDNSPTSTTPTSSMSKAPFPYAHSPPLQSYLALLNAGNMNPLAKVVKIESWETVKNMLGGFWLFQQEHMGIDRDPLITEMKLPTQIFTDFRPNGPQRWILQAIKTFSRTHQWPKNEFPYEENFSDTMELIRDIKSRLHQRDYIKKKYLYIKFLSPIHQEEVKTNYKLEDVEFVDYISHATHILKEDPTDEEGMNLDAGYLRTIDRKDDLCFVHWWYYPDSYDQWVDTEMVAGTDPDTLTDNSKWIVHYSWIKHSKLFNEFMNPIDYEPDEERIYEKLEEDIRQEVEINPSILTMQPRAIGEEQNRNASSPEHTHSPGMDSNKRKRSEYDDVDNQIKRVRTSGPSDYSNFESADFQIIFPEACNWFSMEDIHTIEKKEFPDFFDGSDPMRNPQLYKRYRNFIIRKFHANPRCYLTATECRQVLIGDVTVIMHIHAFLESCGLINDGLTSKNTTIRVTANVLNQDFIPSGPGKSMISFSGTKQNIVCHGTKHKTSNSQTSGNLVWTQEENLRLFDGVLRFGDDWESVAKFVGTKSSKDCMTHFAQLPLEEEFYRDAGDVPRVKENTVQHVVPFADTSNPIMATVTFLASMVSPNVVAATTKAAIEAFEKEGASTIELKDKEFDVNQLDVKTSSAVALGVASARAKLISQRDEREITRIAEQICEKQMKKFELKSQYMDQLIQILEQERLNLEVERKRLGAMNESMNP